MERPVTTLWHGLSAAMLLSAAAVLPAHGQAAQYSGEFEQPYGMGFGDSQRAYNPVTRDRAGNRIIIDGRLVYGDDLSTLNYGMNTPWGSTSGTGMLGQSLAIGNQLNVITNGSYNTIIIDSTQINNGDQTAILNGELDLHD